jgi:hypothetical protein
VLQITDPHPKNKFAIRGGVCQRCGKEILPRRLRGKIVGRDRRFCSNKCRQAAFRNADFERRHPARRALRNDRNNPIVSAASNGDFAGRASPEVTAKLWRKAVQIERPWLRSGEAIVSPDGVQCFIVGALRRAR